MIKRFEKGQAVILVLGMIAMLLLALTLSFDFGRFFLLRSRVRTIADTAALAGAGALDIQRSAGGNFVMNTNWAQTRALEVYQKTLMLNPKDSWMTISLGGISVNGRSVTVTVNGSCASVWGGFFGIGSFSTSVTADARAAVGITRER
jgi:uncharacterized membrane protein